MTYMHIGKDFTPPDIEGKVTGAARYAEDFRRDGLVFARLLTSPIPAGRVVSIDASEAPPVAKNFRFREGSLSRSMLKDARLIMSFM